MQIQTTSSKTSALKRGMDHKRLKMILGIFFTLPALVLLFIFLVLPAILALIYSFTDYQMLKPGEKSFVGLDNFIMLFQDELFFISLKNTLYFVLVVVPLQSATALILALLVNKKVKIAKIARIGFFSPVITSMVVVSILWTFLYNVDQGVINALLNAVGIPSQPFLLSPDQAMNSIIVMSVWQGAGYQMMLFLAGLQEVPDSLYEAAEIDGANAWNKFWNVTYPSIYHVTTFVLIITTIQAFKLFTQPFVMTNGGPMKSTKTLIYMLYEQGFQFRDVGYSSAIAIVFFLIVFFVSLLMKRALIKD